MQYKKETPDHIVHLRSYQIHGDARCMWEAVTSSVETYNSGSLSALRSPSSDGNHLTYTVRDMK